MANFSVKALLTTIAVAPIYAHATNDNNGGNSSGNNTIFPIKSYPVPSGKGNRIPGRLTIDCIYNCGQLTFKIPSGIETLTVTVLHQESGELWFDFIDDLYPTMEVGTLSGTYIISIVTDISTEFSGSFSV